MPGLGINIGNRINNAGGSSPPTAPTGFILLVDSDGAYLVDSDGAYLIGAI